MEEIEAEQKKRFRGNIRRTGPGTPQTRSCRANAGRFRWSPLARTFRGGREGWRAGGACARIFQIQQENKRRGGGGGGEIWWKPAGWYSGTVPGGWVAGRGGWVAGRVNQDSAEYRSQVPLHPTGHTAAPCNDGTRAAASPAARLKKYTDAHHVQHWADGGRNQTRQSGHTLPSPPPRCPRRWL